MLNVDERVRGRISIDELLLEDESSLRCSLEPATEQQNLVTGQRD